MIDMNKLLTPLKTIAVVGLSDKQERPGNQVAKYLMELGQIIIPVNPNIKSIFGLKYYKKLTNLNYSLLNNLVNQPTKPLT